MKKEDIDYSVYLVTDRRNKTDEEFLNIIEEAIKGGTTVVQLREKTASTKEFYDLALRVKEITSRYGVPLLINDRIDIALAVDSEGVHIGQDDMPADIAREIIGEDKILGVSASTVEKDFKDYGGNKDAARAVGKTLAARAAKKKIKEVVFDRKYGVQFSPVLDGRIYNTPTYNATLAAKICLEGVRLSEDAMFFLNPRTAESSWIVNSREYAYTIGGHDFYK